ncbi:CBP4-domain-containing protein [Lasiosphaeria hispida]|uniref:Cytochrome b mRNA-processing protein 4 n=1 Tax=Lasiosphaeria hispida TaxID=260671 RepID=A0AAJ0HVJ5_9PEZI|nr:CBP4-domain-containing protein [Lasiosphaeria hispida]
MAVGGGAVTVGGPAFVMWVSPTDEELVKKYNPELQKRSREGRYEREKEFDDFVMKLKKYSKSNKPIWAVQKDEENKAKEANIKAEKQSVLDEVKLRKEALRREAGLLVESSGSE